MNVQYTYDNKGKLIGVFIPMGDWKKITRKYKELEKATGSNGGASKEEILESIAKGLREVKLHRQGTLKLKTLDALLNEVWDPDATGFWQAI